MNELTIVVPVKNEESNIAELVSRISAAMKTAHIKYDLIFVDDNSTDQTRQLIESHMKTHPVRLHKKVGKAGKAYSILEASRLTTAPFLAMIDGDLQYPPEILPELLEVARKHGVAVGNRTKRHTSSLRKLLSKGYKYVFGCFLMGIHADIQSGIKVFRREVITHISERDVTAWTLDMPLLHTARELGYDIGSVDMEFAERVGGESKVRVFRASTEIGLRALKLKLSRRKFYKIEPTEEGMIGAGMAFRRKRYVTHTDLSHKNSAMVTVTGGQKIAIATILAAISYALFLNPFATALAFVALLSFIYFVDVLFSGFVLLKSLHFPPEISVSDEQLAKLSTNLPVYSVLCPLYKEAHILPQFVEAMDTLDWPKDKLEVLLLLEADDTETIKTAQKMKLPSHFKIVVVPDSFPKTKPKACNYGLSKSNGEYVVIYDAEDKPDPLQLKKVFIAFNDLGPRYGCIQCKLNYFNPTHNILTRLFTAEYSLWFDVILPGLQSIEGTIPLGGTSNHFRRADLIKLSAWDPFNVTEDADLGVRLFKSGYKTAIVDSTTLEEANSRVRNWIRQRSRWIKGYFQTYLVHMRNPISFFRQQGIHALIFQLVIGMRMTFMLINPLLWAITIAYFTLYKYVGPSIEALFPSTVFYMAGFALVVGNFMYIYNYMIGCAKRGHWGLIKFIFLVPIYWLLTSVAATMALWQLITKPHYWEKTNHGLHLKKEEGEVADEDEPPVDELPTIMPAPATVNQPSGIGSVFSGSAFLIGSSMFANVINFLYSTYIGRSVGFAEFGLVSLFGSIINLAQIPLSSYSRTITHKSAYLLGKYGSPVADLWVRLRSGALLPTLIITGLWLVATPFMGQFFQTDRLVPFLLVTPIWAIGVASAIDSGYLSGNHRFGVLGIMTIAEVLAKFASAVFFTVTGKTDLLYLSIPISALVSFGIGWIAILMTKSVSVEIESKDLAALSRKFMGSTFLTKLAGVAFLSIDVVLAKHYLSPIEAGQYSMISLVGKMVYFLGTLFTQFVNPLVSKNEGAGVSSRNTFIALSAGTGIAVGVGFISFGLLGVYTLPLLLGDKVISVLPYLIPYTFAMGAIALAGGIVNFHQSKEKHIFAFISLVGATYMLGNIMMFHESVGELSLAVSVSGTVYLCAVLILHIAVSLLPQKTLQKSTRILIMNWRDIKHAWAGGAEVYVHELAKTWVKEGKEVTLFCGNDRKNAPSEVIDGVQIIRRGGHYTVYFWAFVYYIAYLGRKCDIIVESENGLPFFTPLYSNKPAFLLVHHIHQDVFRTHLKFPLSTIAMAIEKHLMPLVYRNQQIITVSESTKKDLLELGFVKSEHVEVITPGVELSQYKTLKKTAHPSFVYVGRLRHYKNIDVAIRAFAFVVKRHPDARFTIAGEGEIRNSLERLVAKLGLTGLVTFKGRIDEYEKAVLLAKSWAAVQPSSFEGWGITVIEANAAGTPVIASRVNGLVDSVIHEETGVLVSPKNVIEWAETMHLFIEDKTRRLKLSKSAKKWSQNFSWHKSSISFLDKIEQHLSI